MATNKADTSQGNVFHKTRRDHSNEIAEDYVEAIAQLHSEDGACRVTRLARRLGVSHVTANRTVARLVSRGLVTTSPYQPIELTDSGRRLARTAKARHEIVIDFLISIGVPAEIATADSEGIEHHCSPETLKAMKHFSNTRNH
ncbi:MAG TPA: transcriptional regulator MntR [Phycisphaerales bacterium]|nr:transcriptional regulator MntR [Phycisphaerales bacterium]|tara:strand:- start:162 stop:590 length:429 start_codon:yes stop_codon:yes gene_type:complete